MQIDNMTETDLKTLEGKVQELRDENPLLEARIYPMEDQPTNAKIFEKLEAIERLLIHTLDGHVLIDGEFKKVL